MRRRRKVKRTSDGLGSSALQAGAVIQTSPPFVEHLHVQRAGMAQYIVEKLENSQRRSISSNPQYGSGLRRQRAVFPRYDRSRPPSLIRDEKTDSQS